jgi:UDP-N-acetylglucosamine diphosphorylase/glucosamine-1-phosphate N-acetyltransferase
MKIECCFFEDKYLENFHPLTLTRPVFDLRVGIFTLAEKWMRALGIPGTQPRGILREHLNGVFQKFTIDDSHNDVYWINPRFVPTKELGEKVKSLITNQSLVSGEEMVAARITCLKHRHWVDTGIRSSDLDETYIEEDKITSLKNSWELFQVNGREIVNDIALLNVKPSEDPGKYPHSILINPQKIFIEPGANIEPGAMLLAKKGPIYVGKGAHVMANSVIRGPSAVCEKSVVRMGAKIYEDTTIGPVCKVGGEIANVIFHSYSNKAHDGYTGNSVFGQWCNLGADTNTSNLKNNYSSVKVFDWKTKKEFDTGQQFIGTIMGDHSKTGINSMLNTGTMCGVCCNLFSDDYPPKFVPSFSWVSGNNIVPYHFEKAIEAMEKMMQRREVPLTAAYHRMMKAIFQSTSF